VQGTLLNLDTRKNTDRQGEDAQKGNCQMRP
jgi:hypothetical protein